MSTINNDAPLSQAVRHKDSGPAGQGPSAQQSSLTHPSTDLVRRFEHAFENSDEDSNDQNNAASGANVSADAGVCIPLGETQGEYVGHAYAQTGSQPRDSERSRVEQQRKERTTSEEKTDEHHPLGMTHPLDGMFPMPAATQAMGAPSAQEIEQLPDQAWQSLAERILVTETPQSGAREVHILVNQNILPGTEISLTRHADGSLHALLLTDDAAAFQTLVAKREDLRQRLERLGADSVSVDVGSRGESDAGDMRRRSRGLVQPVPGVEE